MRFGGFYRSSVFRIPCSAVRFVNWQDRAVRRGAVRCGNRTELHRAVAKNRAVLIKPAGRVRCAHALQAEVLLKIHKRKKFPSTLN